jgi:hypothetical protein
MAVPASRPYCVSQAARRFLEARTMDRCDHLTQPEAVDAMGLASGGKVRRIFVGLKY